MFSFINKLKKGLFVKQLKYYYYPDKKDDRDFIFKTTKKRLPPKVTLEKFVREIENQEKTNSCTANAACSSLELKALSLGINVNLSRLFVYFNERIDYPKLKGKDSGAYLRDAFKSINKYGVPSESVWEFNYNLINVQPPKSVYEKAKQNKVIKYERIKNIQGIKESLYNGNSVIFGMAIGEQFINLNKNINQQNYKKINNTDNKLIGYHAMNIIGYDDIKMNVIVENSWGKKWGDNGLCLIPYSVLESDGQDFWVCTEALFLNNEIVKPKNNIKNKKNFLQKIIDFLKGFFK